MLTILLIFIKVGAYLGVWCRAFGSVMTPSSGELLTRITTVFREHVRWAYAIDGGQPIPDQFETAAITGEVLVELVWTLATILSVRVGVPYPQGTGMQYCDAKIERCVLFIENIIATRILRTLLSPVLYRFGNGCSTFLAQALTETHMEKIYLPTCQSHVHSYF